MMNLKQFFVRFLMALMLVTPVACSDDNGGGGSTPPPPGGDTNGKMEKSQLTGCVTLSDGTPVNGVTVASGTAQTLTDELGTFNLQNINVVSKRSVVRFSKEGYFDVVRAAECREGDIWNVVMTPKTDASITTQTQYDATEGAHMEAAGMQIDMPQDGYMDAATGATYTGEVKADMIYLSPDNEQFADMMPGGDLSAVRTDGSASQLISYGMTAVNMTSPDGKKLQLREGHEATLRFPIPEGMRENLPATIPLWSFNEKTGKWEEEGVATLTNDAYVGTVKHFSWVNLDVPEEVATIKGTVRDTDGNLVTNTRITVGQIVVRTDSEGKYETKVPAGTAFELRVKPKDYGNYRNTFSRPIPPIEPEEERVVNIVLPSLTRISGRIVNKSGGSALAPVYMTYGDNQTETKYSSNKGVFNIISPEGYTGAATICILTPDNDIVKKTITLTGHSINIGDIAISSQASFGGEVNVKLNSGGNLSIPIVTDPENPLEGVFVVDGQMTVIASDYEDEEEEELSNFFKMQISTYSSNQTEYTDVDLQMASNEHMIFTNKAKVNIKRKGNTLQYNLNGKGLYQNAISYEGDSASISADNIAFNLVMISSVKRNMTPTNAGFPSFTPALAGNAPVMLAITEAPKLGKGGMIYYNGTLADFRTLKKAADKSGIKRIAYEEEKEYDYAEAVYSSNGKLIIIEYDGEGDIIDSNYSPIYDDRDCQLTITVLDGMKVDFQKLMGRNIAQRSARPTRKPIFPIHQIFKQ